MFRIKIFAIVVRTIFTMHVVIRNVNGTVTIFIIIITTNTFHISFNVFILIVIIVHLDIITRMIHRWKLCGIYDHRRSKIQIQIATLATPISFLYLFLYLFLYIILYLIFFIWNCLQFVIFYWINHYIFLCFFSNFKIYNIFI